MRCGKDKVPMTPALRAEIIKNIRFYGTGDNTNIIDDINNYSNKHQYQWH